MPGLTFITIAVLLLGVVFLAGLAGKYHMDLLTDFDGKKLHDLNVQKLELKRFLSVTSAQEFANAFNKYKKTDRYEIGVDDVLKPELGCYDPPQNELSVYGCVKGEFKEIFNCPYSDENKIRLRQVVEEYNRKYVSFQYQDEMDQDLRDNQ